MQEYIQKITCEDREILGYHNFCSACKDSREENGELICRDKEGAFYGKPVSHVLLAPCMKNRIDENRRNGND